MTYRKINEALNSLRPGLASDGFQLLVESVGSNGTVTVVIEGNENSCMDCLVPDDMLTGMIEMAIRPVYTQLNKVNLVKRIEDNNATIHGNTSE